MVGIQAEKRKKREMIPKLQEQTTVIKDTANMWKMFHQYYSILYKGQKFSW